MDACFNQAARLDALPIEAVRIPYGGAYLPGYFASRDRTLQQRPSLVVVGGTETFAQDCYLMIAPAALERGYNVLAVDLPGQGMHPGTVCFSGQNQVEA
jgi:hypothetical protein